MGIVAPEFAIPSRTYPAFNMLALLLLLPVFASAQNVGLGGCPKGVTVQEGFDVSKYMGRWYEIERIPTIYQVDQYCNSATYTLQDDGHVGVINAGLDKNGAEISIVGDAVCPNEKEPAKCGVRFFEDQPYGNYWVIDTDYKTYSLVYSCQEVSGLASAQSAWILSRERTLDEATVQRLKSLGEKMGVRVSYMKETKQTDC